MSINDTNRQKQLKAALDRAQAKLNRQQEAVEATQGEILTFKEWLENAEKMSAPKVK